MNERSIVIAEKDGAYQIHNTVLNKFELLGLLEQVIFDLKYSKERNLSAKSAPNEETAVRIVSNASETDSDAKAAALSAETSVENEVPTAKTPSAAAVSSSAADLRTRIGNAVKAIRDLGGKAETADLSAMGDTELQAELEKLTVQYKRLKSSQENSL